ncbi:variable surface protein [Plasmodium gonderi]|uniref:Variable surface protein n=1 Tax=Plasmodium gonderi TaxID=77519 RepID=A0A1Y1JS88_PLAGO|nr:variable surface protein [Plasmodium gonderi]GAW84335.1 variable surface protein [Plasmodium gonderi]
MRAKLLNHLVKQLYLGRNSYNCSIHFKDLDDKAYGVFDILDTLYNIIYKINGRECYNSERVSCDRYIKKLKSCEYKDGVNFKKFLKNIEIQYEQISPKSVVRNEVKHDASHRNSMTETGTETELKKTKIASSSKTLEPEISQYIGGIKVPKKIQLKLRSENTDTGSVNGISTSTIVLMPVIVTISIILYKLIYKNIIFQSYYQYTTYGALLQKSVKKLKRLLNKKNKEHLNLKNSYKKAYENITDYNYQLAYSSIDS